MTVLNLEEVTRLLAAVALLAQAARPTCQASRSRPSLDSNRARSAMLASGQKNRRSAPQMLSQPSEYRHIVVDDAGTAFVEGTRMKVRLVVLQHLANGWSAEELKRQFPNLTIAQIHDALAYYYHHQKQMEAETREELAELSDFDSRPGLRFTREQLEQRLRR